MKNTLLLSMILLLSSCNEHKKIMVEKLDINQLEKEGEKTAITNTNFSYELIKQFKDGSSFELTGSVYEKGFVKREYPAKPSFETIYKEYYTNGNLKKKETLIGQYVKVGNSLYYNEDGSLDKTINEDKKFGKIKYQDVLSFLGKKKYINLTTGEGRMDEDGRSVFNLYFKDENGKKFWIIEIVKGKHNDKIPNGIGEPVTFLSLDYVMDGETGDVVEEK